MLSVAANCLPRVVLWKIGEFLLFTEGQLQAP